MIRLFRWARLQVVALTVVQVGTHAAAAHAAGPAYHFINPSQAAQTVVLTGHDLTVEQVAHEAGLSVNTVKTHLARGRVA